MNKKIIVIVISLLVTLLISVGVFFFIIKNSSNGEPSNSNPNNTTPTGTTNPQNQSFSSLETYTLSVTTFNKDLSGTLIANGATSPLAQSDIEKYALVSFNSTYDILWVLCPNGYTLTNPYSSTGNNIDSVPLMNEINIEIAADKKNNIIFTCDKTIAK